MSTIFVLFLNLFLVASITFPSLLADLQHELLLLAVH